MRGRGLHARAGKHLAAFYWQRRARLTRILALWTAEAALAAARAIAATARAVARAGGVSEVGVGAEAAPGFPGQHLRCDGPAILCD